MVRFVLLPGLLPMAFRLGFGQFGSGSCSNGNSFRAVLIRMDHLIPSDLLPSLVVFICSKNARRGLHRVLAAGVFCSDRWLDHPLDHEGTAKPESIQCLWCRPEIRREFGWCLLSQISDSQSFLPQLWASTRRFQL